MKEAAELERLLGGLQAEGALDSQGIFTLDEGANREKMSLFLQQDEGLWFYWWVRCGLQLGALEAHLQLGRNGMVATLLQPQGEELSRFLSGESPLALPLLRQCLLWCQSWLVGQPGFRAHLQFGDRALLLDGRGLQRHAPHSTCESLQLAFLPPSTRDWTDYFSRLRTRLRECLGARLGFCPLPVFFNGERLDGGELPGHSFYLRYYLQGGPGSRLAVRCPHEFGAHRYQLGDNVVRRPRFCLPAARTNLFSLAGEVPEDWCQQGGQVVARWQEGAGPHQLALDVPPQSGDRWLVRALLRRGQHQRDLFGVVQQGVRLDWELLELAPQSDYGWTALVALDSATTDLSGLRLTRTPLVQELLVWVIGEIADIHRLAAHQSGN